MKSTVQIQLPEFLQQRLQVSLEDIAAFCDRWNIAEFALFGSVLREDFRPDSDIDVFVTFSPQSSGNFFEIIYAKEELEKLFGRDVDFTQKKGLVNPFSRAEILHTHRVIYPFDRLENFEVTQVNKMERDNARNSAALFDILQAIREIQEDIANLTYRDYLENRLVRRAVERNCEIIGEAVRRITPEFREAHPEVDWLGAVGLRNIIIHQYDRVDNETIRRIITSVLPPLLAPLEQLLPPLPEMD